MSPVLRKVGAKTSVPNTALQSAVQRRLGTAKPRLGRLRCQCGTEVRDGFVRCQRCDDRVEQELLTKTGVIGRARMLAKLRQTQTCDCGRPRAPEAPCCPRCCWLDGVKVDSPYIELIRDCGELTGHHLAEMLGRDPIVVREDLRRLARIGRLRAREVEQGQTQVWYSLVD